MTLIAFTARPDSVDLVTDTLAYELSGRSLSHCSKVDSIPHLDMITMVQGAGPLSAAWRLALHTIAHAADATFDGVAELATEALPALWDDLHEDWPAETLSDSVVFLIGYSTARGRFVAYHYPSAAGFARHDVSDKLSVLPHPLSDLEQPRTVSGWVGLAQQLRNERALAPIGLKVFIGGDVLHTHLERGSVTHRRVHTFADDGEEFDLMVAGTLHPRGQLGDCPCGSGKMLALCHTYEPDSTCTCGRGGRFADCCSVTPDQVQAALQERQAARSEAQMSRRERRAAARRS